MVIENTVKLIKNIWFLVVSAIASTSFILVKIEEYSPVVSEYDVEIGVGLFSVLFVAIFTVYHLTHRKIDGLRSEIVDSLKGIRDNQKQANIIQFRSDFEATYDRLIRYESLRLAQLKRVHELEEQRIAVGEDGYYKSSIQRLFDKPVEDD